MLKTEWAVGPLTSDTETVRELIYEVITATYPPATANPTLASGYSHERVEEIMHDRTWFEVRDENGQLLAVAAVRLTGDVAVMGSAMSRVRGEGIGKALTAARLNWARERGVKTASAHVHPWNKASIANLTHFGFTHVRSEADTWTGHGDLYVYQAPLN